MRIIFYCLLSIACFSSGGQVIQKLPSLSLEDYFSENSVALQQLPDNKKAKLLITFGPSLCSACSQIIDNLSTSEVVSKFGVYAVNIDKKENIGLTSAYKMDDWNKKGIHVLDDEDWRMMKAMKMTRLPRIFFLDQSNNIIYCHESYTINSNQINYILGLIAGKEIEAGKKLYFDKDWMPTEKKKAVYYRTTKTSGSLIEVNDFYANGKLQMNGKAELLFPFYHSGEFTYYDNEGHLTSKSNYADNELNGNYEAYYPNGIISTKETYQRGKLNGPVTFYYDNGKVKTSGGAYNNGLKEGEWKDYYPDGTLGAVTNWQSNKRQGNARGYYEDGRLYYDVNFVDNTIDYHQPASVLNNDGKPALTHIKLDQSGRVNYEYLFVDGTKKVLTDENNNIRVEFRDLRGRLISEYLFSSDYKPLYLKEYNANNQIINWMEFNSFKLINARVLLSNNNQFIIQTAANGKYSSRLVDINNQELTEGSLSEEDQKIIEQTKIYLSVNADNIKDVGYSMYNYSANIESFVIDQHLGLN